MNSPSDADKPAQRPLHEQRPSAMDFVFASLSRPLEAIAKNIWMSEGISNSYLIATAEGDVVINTGLIVEGAIHRQNYDRVSTAPVHTVILTQAHVDHVGGLAAFNQPGTDVIAHVNTHACQADDARIKGFRDIRSPRFYSMVTDQLSVADQEAMQRGLQNAMIKGEPTRTISEPYAFTLGGERIEVLPLPAGETIDSLAVWLPERRIVFTGNAFGPLFPNMPNLHTIRGDRPRSAAAFIETCERILALQPEMLVTGHFEPILGADVIAREVGRLRDAVQYVHDETVKGMNEGRDLYALMREIRLPPELQVGEKYGTVAWAVQAIWYGYAGWFLYKSTTELYPAPVADIYADLARMAGPDALVGAAQQRLDAGKPLEAIHFAEIALAGDASHAAALEVYRDAHLKLIPMSVQDNRWFHFWLGGEIDAANKKLSAIAESEVSS